MRFRTDSIRRTVRTLYQGLVALMVAVPVVMVAWPTDFPTPALLVTFVAWLTIVTRIHNALEDAGLIPDWLNVER